MAMHWDFEDRHFAGEGNTGILHLRGFLGDTSLDQFNGAVDWALSRSSVPLVIDLSNLLGCSEAGITALKTVTQRIAGTHRPVAICAPADVLTQLQNHDLEHRAPISTHDNLTAALAAVHA